MSGIVVFCGPVFILKRKGVPLDLANLDYKINERKLSGSMTARQENRSSSRLYPLIGRDIDYYVVAVNNSNVISVVLFKSVKILVRISDFFNV